MKWIKYQIVQSTVGEEIILANKKVGYSNENLAIAQKEAYNGYEIIDDSQSFEKEPLGIEVGGTGAKDAATARQKLGITPKNIGALSTSGGEVAGTVAFYNPEMSIRCAEIKNGTFRFRQTNPTDAWTPSLQLRKSDDSAILGAYGFYKGNGDTLDYYYIGNTSVSPLFKMTPNGTISLASALPVASGGHGATTPEQARQNLGIIPENIGAVKESEYYGPIKKEGSICQAKCYEGTGIHVVTEFSPKQEGSGDPYPAGGGKNLIYLGFTSAGTVKGITFTPNEDGSITLTGTKEEGYAGYIGPAMNAVNLRGKTLTLTVPNPSYIRVGLKVINTAGETVWLDAPANEGGYTFTMPDNAETMAYNCYIPTSAQINYTFYPQLELGSTATEYAPYSNIRPITGYDAVELNHAGKNLMPPRGESITANGITITANADGSVTYNGTATATLYHRVSDYFKLAAGEYILSGCAQGSSSTTYFMRLVDSNQAAIGFDYGGGYRATLATESDYLQVHVVIANGLTVSNLTFYPMIRLASDPDATFQPYTNTLHTVQIGQTVYGGKLDWNRGVMVVDWKMETLDGTENWTQTNGKYGLGGKCKGAIGYEVVCSHFKNEIYFQASNSCIVVYAGGYIDIRYTEMNTADELKSYIAAQYAAGNPVQILYKLAEPQEIQLDKIGAIEALNGINTIYSNADNCIVEFGHAPDLGIIYSAEEPAYQAGAIWLKPIE